MYFISRLKFYLFLFLNFPGFVISLHSQSLSSTSYTTKEGLPSNIITAIYQDHNGYIWIGTTNGLAKYDGAEFTVYSTLNGLSNNWITSITENPSKPGSIWIGTIAGGVNKYQNGVFHSYKFGADPDWNNVSDFCVDKNGVIWVVVKNGFLKIIDDSIRIITDKDAPQNPDLIYTTKDGNILCSEENHIFSYNPVYASWKKLELQISKTSVITSIIQDSKDKIWIGTSDKIILELSDSGVIRKEKSKYGIPYQLQDDGQGTLLVRSRDIFFSISKEKLFDQKILPLPENKDMPEDVTSPFLFDNEGNMWIGTWLKGLLKVSDLSLLRFKFPATPKLNWTNIDQNGNIWAGASGGVWEIYPDQNQWQQKFHPIHYMGRESKVYISLIDPENNIWLNINGQTFVYKIINGIDIASSLVSTNLQNLVTFLNKGTLLAIYADRQNRLWFSIAELGVGAADLKTGKLIKFYNEEDGIPGVAVRAIFQDAKNQIWMGGWQQGLSIFSNDSLPSLERKITMDDGLPDNMIRSIYEDRSGNIWIGTRHNGVVLIDAELSGKLKNFSMKDGLLSNSIWGIIEGPDNKMWLNTDVGIEQIDLNTLKVLSSKKEYLISFDQSLSMKSYKRKLWCFSSNEELFILKNQAREKKIIFPPIEITNFTVNGNNFSISELSDLSYTQNNITIKFAGLSFKEEQAVTYQYRLIGTSDTNWTSPSNQRYISFASLEPGEYLFEVHAINSEGVRSKIPASVAFTIMQPFWRQWWFILIAFLIVAALLILLHRFRVNQLLKLELMRARISSDLHDEIGSSVGSIVLRSRMLQKDNNLNEKSREELDRIQQTALQTSETMRDIVWFISPEFETLDDMILRMKDTAQSLLAGIKYDFISPAEVFLLKPSLEFRRNIFLSYKEILHNIIKHSKATNVTIQLSLDGRIFSLKISDNGIGFVFNQDEFVYKKSYSGNGIKNLYKRMDAIKGKACIKSNINKGTVVTLTAKTT